MNIVPSDLTQHILYESTYQLGELYDKYTPHIRIYGSTIICTNCKETLPTKEDDTELRIDFHAKHFQCKAPTQ